MPTRYIEPFGGVTIEANLCGRPVLGSVFGSFTETITNGQNGYRCRTLGDYLAAMEIIESGKIDPPSFIAHLALQKYSMYNLAHRYDEVFQLTDGLWESGKDWYRKTSFFGPVTKAV